MTAKGRTIQFAVISGICLAVQIFLPQLAFTPIFLYGLLGPATALISLTYAIEWLIKKPKKEPPWNAKEEVKKWMEKKEF